MKKNPMRPARNAFACAALVALAALAGCGDSPESQLAKAKESLAKNEIKAAEIHLKNLLQKNDIAEARFLLGTIHLKAGDARSAEKELKRAQEGGFDAARLVVPLTDTLLRLGQPKEAIEAAGKATPADPQDKAKLATTVGHAHMVLGKRDAAKTSFEAALAANPDHAPAQAALATLIASAGDLDGAAAAVERVLAKQPKSYEALTLKGDLALARGDAKGAREAFAAAVAAEPNDRAGRAKIVTIAISEKDFAGAQKALDELKPLTGPAPATMQLQALVLERQGKHTQARDAIEVALRGAPDFLPAMALAAEIYLNTGAFEQSERIARQVVERTPNSPIGYHLLAASLLKMNAPDKALHAIQPVLEKGSKDPALYSLAGEAALRANDTAKATAYFEKAIQLDPADPRKKAGLAYAHIAAGDKDRGIAELEQVSAMADSGAQADLALIAAHLRDRKFDKALAAIDRLEKKQPDSALAANLRGSTLLAKGDATGARKAFELALERDPKSLGATSNLANLDLRERKPDDAKKRFVTLLEKDPKNIQAMLSIAQIIQRTAAKDDKKAREEIPTWLKKAYETDKTSVAAVTALAGWMVGNDQVKDAIPLLQDALATRADDVQLLDALGTAYLRSDQETLGMQTLEKVLRAKPENAGLQMRMGQFKLSRNDTAGAMANFRRAAELEPKAIEPRAGIAAVLLRTGKAAEARQVATTLQKEQPKNPAGAVLEGDIAVAERKFGEAAGSYRKALALKEELPTRIKLHQVTAANGDQQDADAMLRTMLKNSPDNVALRAYAAESEMQRKRWPEVVAHYKALLEKQPGNVLALNNMAWAMHELKDPNALDTAEKAFAAAPTAPAILDTLGMILVESGKSERGLGLLRQAVAASPKAPALRLHLAEALIKTGDKAAARQELDAVMKDFPSGAAAERAKELQKQL